MDRFRSAGSLPGVNPSPLIDSCGRILAAAVTADRDFPPAPRSVRDGYAVRSADLPGTLRITGEVRAGEPSLGTVNAGEAIEIMTAPSCPPAPMRW